jgi:coenzyme F420-reducing hydrogenase delta subunit/ferredoxin
MSHGPPKRKVLVLGDGVTAVHLSKKLLSKGLQVILSCPEFEERGQLCQDVVSLPGSRLEALQGQVGEFDVFLSSKGKTVQHRVGVVAVAYEAQCEPSYPIPDTSRHERIWSLTDLEHCLYKKRSFPSDVKNVVFLDNLDGAGTTASSERLFRLILDLKHNQEVICYLLSAQVNVASRGLELLYGQVREGGCLIIKPDELAVKITPKGPSVSFRDPILEQGLTLLPDLLVLGEAYRPYPELDRLSRLLSLETSAHGYLQADNVQRAICLTNRKGILVVGGTICPMTRFETEQNIQAAVTEIHGVFEWLRKSHHPEPIKCNLDLCAVCLTCYRVCPHGAIQFTVKPIFLHLACEGCGMCTSVCPCEALELLGFERAALLRSIRNVPSRENKARYPSIIAFACQKSAAKILQSMDEKDPVRMSVYWIEVPCAGSLRMKYILDSLLRRKTVDGVLVVSCHQDNCRSGTGTSQARQLVGSVKKLLSAIGWNKASVDFISTAPHDRSELIRKILLFRDYLYDLDEDR